MCFQHALKKAEQACSSNSAVWFCTCEHLAAEHMPFCMCRRPLCSLHCKELCGGCGQDHAVPVSDNEEHSENSGSLSNVSTCGTPRGCRQPARMGFVTAIPLVTFRLSPFSPFSVRDGIHLRRHLIALRVLRRESRKEERV